MCGSTGKATADQQCNGLLVSLKKKQTPFFIGLVPGESYRKMWKVTGKLQTSSFRLEFISLSIVNSAYN